MPLVIFISYSQEDYKKEALFLGKYVQKHTPYSEVFIDQIKAKGGKWDKEIEDKLLDSHIFVVILTNGAIKSRAVKNEVEMAKDNPDRKIIPCKDELLDIIWSKVPWDLGSYDGIEFETKEELGRKLVKEIKKIRKMDHKLQIIDFDAYLDETYGRTEIAWLKSLPTSLTLKEFDRVAYEEGFADWSIDSAYEIEGEDNN